MTSPGWRASLAALLLLGGAGCAAGPVPPPTGCPQGQIECGDGCADPGECEEPPSCTDECPADGATECAGDGWRSCGEQDGTDACLEWSAVEACPAGLICDPTTVTCREACGDHCEPFSVVLLPDTQYYTSKQDNVASNTYHKQTRWVVDNREAENIQTVIHLGDITGSNQVDQWVVADAAHDILDAADMPYSMVPGNHDYLSSTGFDRANTHFDEYFGAGRFEGRSWYGGRLGGSNVNNYTFFEVGPMRFMVVSLEYAPRKDALCRAEQLIADHPDHRVIVATHCYRGRGGYAGNCPDNDYIAIGSDGATVWDELVSRHSNIFMVVAGHIGGSTYVPREANAGNTVHQILVDYQFEAACSAGSPEQCTSHCGANTYTGNGWLRQMIFDPRAGEIRAHTLTVEDGDDTLFPGGEPRLFCSEYNVDGKNYYDSDPLAQDHDYAFTFDMASPVDYVREDLGRLAFLDRTVNSAGAGDQVAPRVALSPTGGFVAVWEDDSSAADGAGNHDILARGFAPGGCGSFGDVVVNTATAGQQATPDVAADAAGNFVVVWADDQDGNGTYQIKARGFLADGSERFAAFTVNSVATGQQLHPAVAMAPDGRFVVAWQDDPEDDGTYQILVRGFAADGSERLADRSVHADAAGQRVLPAVGLDAGAGFVVAWQDDTDGNGTYQIHARGFAADGSERVALRAVNSVSTGQQRQPAIGVDAAGGFVVAWEDDQDGDGLPLILARGFHADGSQRIADFRVESSTSGQHRVPEIGVAADGSFVVTWQADGDGNGTYQIAARAFHADGGERLAEWTVNRVSSGQQLAPHVGATEGTVVVIWRDDMDDNGVGQILSRGVDLP